MTSGVPVYYTGDKHVSFPSPSRPPRTPRWPFLVLIGVSIAGLWLLDARQPAPWPESATPWFSQARALSPVSAGLDRLNALTALTPDLPGGSALAWLAVGVSTLGALLALDVAPLLALAVAIGLLGTRSVWSTVTSGSDALPVLVVSAAALLLARPGRRLAGVVTAAVVALVAPPAAWIAAPALASGAGSARRRTLAVLGLAVAALAVQVLLLRHAWQAVPCLDGGSWLAGLRDVLRPGRSADASAWTATRQALAVLVGDVHLFGIAVAAFGLVATGARATALRAATLAAAAIAVGVVAAGLMPPALTAALLLPWWAPWYGLGLATLVARTVGTQRRVALVFAALVASAVPVLRHTTVVPAPWVAGTPSIARAVAAATPGAVFAAEDDVSMRRLRRVGLAPLPLDRATLSACIAAGRRVSATGPAIDAIEQWGFTVQERPLLAPIAAVLRDVRADQLVALALTPSSLPWAGPAGLASLARLDVRRDALPPAAALGVIARTDRGGRVSSGRDGVDLALGTGDVLAGRQLLAPVSLGAHAGRADVDSAPTRLVTSGVAAAAIFDRSQEIALRSPAQAAPGLPLALATHVQWRHAVVSGVSECSTIGTQWTTLPATMTRISVPAAAATPGRPAVVWLASDARPIVDVSGLLRHPVWPDWRVRTFDRQDAADADRLRERLDADEVPGEALQRRFVARVEIRPRQAWHAERAGVAAGVTPVTWLVRIPGTGGGRDARDVCRMAAPGDRLLLGRYGVADDDSVRELDVWAWDGWHRPERIGSDVIQWSARPTATVGFRIDAPQPLVLAMDATGAATASGNQPIEVRVNGVRLGSAWSGAARIDIPASALRAGDNAITLDVPQLVQPPGEARALGVLVRQLRVIEAPR